MNTTLQAHLLAVIEEQQQQLKQQQLKQEEALKIIQAQAGTIEELKTYTATLNSKHSEAVQVVAKYQEIVRKLGDQTISPHFSQNLQANLAEQLQKQFKTLVSGLSIESQVQEELQVILPTLVQREIEKQTKPLADQISEKLTSVQQYHEKFEALIEEVSSRL